MDPRLDALTTRRRLLRDTAAGFGSVAFAALLAIAPSLHELEVVVAEAPEERLCALQRPRVVVRFERGSGALYERGQAANHRAIDGCDDRA